jgi:hypothetical protein
LVKIAPDEYAPLVEVTVTDVYRWNWKRASRRGFPGSGLGDTTTEMGTRKIPQDFAIKTLF